MAAERRHPPIYYQRVAAARVRVVQILTRRVVCYSRELERQVCEVGFDFKRTPPNRRPEPVHYGQAIKSLRRRDIVAMPTKAAGGTFQFLALAGLPDDAVQAVLRRKVRSLTAYMRVERQAPLAGYHAESI